MNDDALFDILSPIGIRIRVARSRWELIVGIKHPVMRDRENLVEATLRDPSEIRRSKTDGHVLLFYRSERPGRWICAVVRQLNGDGFLITAYPTDAVKIGEQLWSA